MQMKEEMTLNNIQELENQIRDYLMENGDIEETVSLIMYKVLLFSLSGVKYNENTLHNKCWEYFDKNKQKLINTIP